MARVLVASVAISRYRSTPRCCTRPSVRGVPASPRPARLTCRGAQRLYGGLCGDAVPAGGFADTHGRKRVFLLGVTPSSPRQLCGLAGNVGWLIAARVLGIARPSSRRRCRSAGSVSAEPSRRDRQPVGRGGRFRGRGPSLGSFIVQTGRLAVGLHQPAGRRCHCGGTTRRAVVTAATRSTRRRGRHRAARRGGAVALAIVEADSPSWTRAQPWDGRQRRVAPWHLSSGPAACLSRWST
jgi:hypothetical protein